MRAVLFDFGGTIDTDGVHWSEKFWEYYERYHIPVPKERFERAFVQSEKDLSNDPALERATFLGTLRKQFSCQFTLLKLQAAGGLLEEVTGACYQDVSQTISGAKNVLEELRPFYTMGVVSNFYGNLEIVCAEFGLDRYFRVMIDSAAVGVRKPGKAIFQIALDRLGVKSSDAFLVGDSYDRDILPAKSLGCRTIWLKGKSWTSAPSGEAADHTVLKFADIKAVLLDR